MFFYNYFYHFPDWQCRWNFKIIKFPLNFYFLISLNFNIISSPPYQLMILEKNLHFHTTLRLLNFHLLQIILDLNFLKFLYANLPHRYHASQYPHFLLGWIMGRSSRAVALALSQRGYGHECSLWLGNDGGKMDFYWILPFENRRLPHGLRNDFRKMCHLFYAFGVLILVIFDPRCCCSLSCEKRDDRY